MLCRFWLRYLRLIRLIPFLLVTRLHFQAAMIQYDDVSIRTTKPIQQELHRKNPDGTYTMLKPLAMRESLDKQLHTFAKLRASDPRAAKEIYELNEQILQLASQGSMRKLKQTIENVSDATHILTYYVVKAFKAALISGHLMIAGYMIDQGYPFQTSKVPHTLLEILSLAQPTYVLSPVPGGKIPEDTALQILDFLIEKNKYLNQAVSSTSSTGGNDIEIVQLAARETWLTPLHICIRYGLYSCVDKLLENRADVNAVGDGDIMPLNLAYKLRKELSGAYIFVGKPFFFSCCVQFY